MSQADTSGTVHFADFAGRWRKFRLRLGETEELEQLCGAGIGAIMVRVASHAFYAKDLRETVRLGLEGGGEPEATATALLIRYQDAPLIVLANLAADILWTAINGMPADLGNGDGARTDDPGTSPPSSPPGPPSGDPPRMSVA